QLRQRWQGRGASDGIRNRDRAWARPVFGEFDGVRPAGLRASREGSRRLKRGQTTENFEAGQGESSAVRAKGGEEGFGHARQASKTGQGSKGQARERGKNHAEAAQERLRKL